jgi:hypothetical protein
MILVVTDASLESVLRSSVVIEQLWPGAAQEVKMLLSILGSKAFPTLADVLVLGLIALMTPAPGSLPERVLLTYRRVVLAAVALSVDAVRIDAPHARANDVVRLEIVDVAVGGLSALKAAV